ncbi:sulfatase-like hydrolase/transferase [Litorilituus sediminis]|uniref:Sulfatase N-terminal domain-containing protein n=1 Tax=Litorilituus sediminis TaxID=718192 RepID=A0A4P6P924_9GAMM|nr:sulfatase-like hydrolase/transferase [Litorilituus sediminis]QBG36799.1 hypothetical protein EMK97_14245 [Litorilituus sediminis]
MLHKKLLPFLILLSMLASAGIYFFNNYSLKLVVTHTLFCLAIYSLCAAYTKLYDSFNVINNSPLFKSLLFALASTILIFLYTGNAISNYFWKANLNLNLINRMLEHYYYLKPLMTGLIMIVIPFIVYIVVLCGYIRIFKSMRKPNYSAKKAAFYYLSISLIIFIQLSSSNISRSKNDLKEYFVGEMFVDLISEYTDPHLDYVNDAGGIKDEVAQSLDYVTQSEENIDYSKKNIIMIVVDCLRADRLQSYGYHRDTTPFINNLISQHTSHQVKHAFALCDESKCGIRSILTSRNIEAQNSLESSQNSLHQKLKDNGYQVNFLLSSDHAFGGLKRVYYPNDFYLDGIGFDAYPLNDDRGLISVLEKWPNYNGSPNYFHFHLFSAHEAGISYGKYLGKGVHGIKPGFLQGEPIEARFSTTDASSEQLKHDEMDNAIYQADLIIYRIHTLLKQKGYIDNALIIITGDHGQGLNEHGYYGHIKGLYNESLRVPLMIIDTANNSLNLTESNYANQHDIAPTIADIVNIAKAPTWKGKSLQQQKSGVTITTHVIPNRSASFAKTIYNPSDGSLFKYIFLSKYNGLTESRYLFNLIDDPKEEINLLKLANPKVDWHNFIKQHQLDIK